jgi:uncharacterized coiled-coil DUF342 family protein
MDDEKLQKTIEFILENQAQFYADLQQIQETQKEAEKRVNVLERVCLNLYNTMIEEGKHIAELREAQQETDARFKETGARFKETDERFRETDERLNAVILMAERFLDGQNGKSE